MPDPARCVTHHYACACREARVKALERVAEAALRLYAATAATSLRNSTEAADMWGGDHLLALREVKP